MKVKTMKEKTPNQLVGRLEELCNITQNKLQHELSAHYKEIDALKEEIIARMK